MKIILMIVSIFSIFMGSVYIYKSFNDFKKLDRLKKPASTILFILGFSIVACGIFLLIKSFYMK